MAKSRVYAPADKQRISAWVDKEMWVKLKIMAVCRGVSLSHLISEEMGQFVSNNEK